MMATSADDGPDKNQDKPSKRSVGLFTRCFSFYKMVSRDRNGKNIALHCGRPKKTRLH